MKPPSATEVLSAHLETMARHHAWATRRLLDGVATMADADYRRDAGLFFRSVHGTLNHLLLADALAWWPRFADGVSPSIASLADEVEPDRTRLRDRLLQATERWHGFVAGLDATRLGGTLEYLRRGEPQSLPFAATLAHVFLHGTHHRGQVTAAMTAMGYACPELDLVRMLQAAPRTEITA